MMILLGSHTQHTPPWPRCVVSLAFFAFTAHSWCSSVSLLCFLLSPAVWHTQHIHTHSIAMRFHSGTAERKSTMQRQQKAGHSTKGRETVQNTHTHTQHTAEPPLPPPCVVSLLFPPWAGPMDSLVRVSRRAEKYDTATKYRKNDDTQHTTAPEKRRTRKGRRRHTARQHTHTTHRQQPTHSGHTPQRPTAILCTTPRRAHTHTAQRTTHTQRHQAHPYTYRSLPPPPLASHTQHQILSPHQSTHSHTRSTATQRGAHATTQYRRSGLFE